MYQYIDGACALSVNDWMAAGLTYSQFKNDSHRGYLKVMQRGIHGETLILVDSIRRADRLRLIELAYGKAKDTNTDIYAVVMQNVLNLNEDINYTKLSIHCFVHVTC